MSQKSYTKGSEFPVLKDGTLRLYSMRFCPFAQRTRLVLAHKKIKFETINVDLKNKPDWFLEKNPLGLVPVLEHAGNIVYESVICNEYLDDIYPQERLTPEDPYRRARDKILLEMYGKFIPFYYKIGRAKGENKEDIQEALNKLELFENTLKERGAYFGGNKVCMLDFYMWPWFERVAGPMKSQGLNLLPEEKFPNLSDWVTRMRNVPAVKETLFDDETHMAFTKSYLMGQPNYDIGL